MELTTIYLNPVDVEVFKNFQKHHALIGLLDSIGAFDIKSGSVTIHFDSLGNIGSVDKHQHYKPRNMP